jgi:HPt (histidine-containing phosphotransfer) domain-containing protein
VAIENHPDIPFPSFDPAGIEGLAQLDRGTPGLLARITGRFLEGSPALIAAVAGASRESLQDAERAAHTLKSTSGRLGAPRLAALCAEAESAAREGNLDRVRALGETMRLEFEQLGPVFASHLQRMTERRRG